MVMLAMAAIGAGIGAYQAYQGSIAEENRAKAEKKRLEIEKRQAEEERAAQRELLSKQIAIGERQRALEAKAINNESKNASIETFRAQSQAEAQAGSGMVSTAGSSLGISLQQRFEQANANLSQSINAATTNLDISGDQQQVAYDQGQIQDTRYGNQIENMKYAIGMANDAINSITDPLNRITQTALGAYSGGQMGYSLGSGLSLAAKEPAFAKIGDFFNKQSTVASPSMIGGDYNAYYNAQPSTRITDYTGYARR